MRYILFCGVCLLIFGMPCVAQILTGLNSLESAIDAEQVAMGESFVAYRAGMMSFKQNPATLTGLKHSTAYYSYRDNEINDSFVNSEFYEFGVTIKNPFGVTNINYARLNLIEFHYMDMNAEIQGKLGIYDEVISLSHGYSLGTNLSLGLSLKWVNFKWYESQVADGDFNYESTPAIVGDIGITYFYNGLFKDDNISDSLTLGASLQNFGSDLKYSFDFTRDPDNETVYQMPRFFKIGFAYGLSAFTNSNLPVFEYVLTAQYGRWLNPQDYYKEDGDLGGIGTKVRLWEAIEFNIGGYYQSYYSYYGNEDVLNIRYGIAINMPFKRWGWNAPITAKISFTHIPINQSPDFLDDNNKRVPVITAQISYNVNMF